MASSTSLICLLLLSSAHAIASRQQVVKEKVTHLHFYCHEIYGGSNATVATVITSPAGSGSYDDYGSIGVGDNMLRQGVEPASPLIGRAQEIPVQASLGSAAFFSLLNFVFTHGAHNGSSISVIGRAVLTEVMDRGIVGGTGRFRMARGYTLSKLLSTTVMADVVYLVLEYDAYIYHDEKH